MSNASVGNFITEQTKGAQEEAIKTENKKKGPRGNGWNITGTQNSFRGDPCLKPEGGAKL